MDYSIIGSGAIGGALATQFASKEIEVLLANSRGPASLKDIVGKLGPKVRAATYTRGCQRQHGNPGRSVLRGTECRQRNIRLDRPHRGGCHKRRRSSFVQTDGPGEDGCRAKSWLNLFAVRVS